MFGVFTRSVTVVQFVITLFMGHPSSQTLIEFQKLRGNSCEFSEFQKRVMNGIEGDQDSRGIRIPPSLPSFGYVNADQSAYETQELNSNLQLARSSYAEQQREGI